MKRLFVVLACLMGSLTLYLATFTVVRRPLTLGDLTGQLDFKLAYAASLPSPKIMILAGSNGRYSHACAPLSTALGRPCVNASIASGIALDFLLHEFGAMLRKGDLVYMPLEYDQYGVSESTMHAGVQNAALLRHRPDYLWQQDTVAVVRTYGAYDLPFLIRGVAEMGLAGASFRRRSGIETLSPQGDEAGHTAEKGRAYTSYLSHAVRPSTRVPASSHAEKVLAGFLADARQRGIVVVGGLPTVPDDTAMDDSDIARLQALYESHGQQFLELANRSRYPIHCFYDTPYHLNESCQRQHSMAVAEALARLPRR